MRAPEQWKSLVAALRGCGLRGTALADMLDAAPEAREAYAREFADDFGHRRAVDPPLLAWVLAIPPWEPPVHDRTDLALWYALLDPSTQPLALLAGGDGPVAPAARAKGIEVWTEIELASLQALWWHARRRHDPRVDARARTLARWLMDELQPDNATNRPWALAAFCELAAEGETDAELYAGTLAHNCQVSLGKPDLLSTILLIDAARCLESPREEH